MDKIIEISQVQKVYGKKIKTLVIDKLDLHFEEGSFNAIIGQSGSGKSTLLNMIGALDTPTAGVLKINNVEINNLANAPISKLRNETLGFVFQFHYLLPEFTALENVLMPFQISNGKVTPAMRQKALELLQLTGVGTVANNKATEMSGGQMQRVAIARSLINDPKILLADEPTGNLDSVSTREIYKLFRKINQELKTTIIIITHDKNVADLADRIIEIKDGKVISDLVRSK
jgi:lipoprotein-releasing system ATP-binding protein